MAQLLLAVQPGFVDEGDASFDAGASASAAAFKRVNANAKYAAVLGETFYGYYRNGETVGLPISPADGYQYSREELRYSWSRVWSGSAPVELNGCLVLPPAAKGATSGEGQVLQWGDHVDQVTGLVACQTDYFKTSHQVRQDGIVLVITHALRNR
jgi:hypothetical protein